MKKIPRISSSGTPLISSFKILLNILVIFILSPESRAIRLRFLVNPRRVGQILTCRLNEEKIDPKMI